MDAITEQDMHNYSQGLQTAIEELLVRVGQSNFNEKLEELRAQGSAVWAIIFHEERAQKIIRAALKRGATIQIVADQLERSSIPWELLYDGPPTEKVDINHFWGMRYHVIRSLRYQEYPPEVIQASTKPTIGIISKDALGGEKFKEHVLSNIKDNEDIVFELVHGMDEEKHSDEIAYLLQFLNEKKLHILHLTCHANTRDPANPYLSVANDFHVRWFEIYNRFKIQDYPLVVLNACRTGMTDPLRTSNWVTLFWKQGAGGIVATEARVLDEYATRFSEELCKHLLEGELISQALFECRHHFWELPEGHPEYNPIGLVYSLYSSSSLRIEKTV